MTTHTAHGSFSLARCSPCHAMPSCDTSLQHSVPRPSFDRDQRHKMLLANGRIWRRREKIKKNELHSHHTSSIAAPPHCSDADLPTRRRTPYVSRRSKHWPSHAINTYTNTRTETRKVALYIYFLINLRLLYVLCFNFLSLRDQNDPPNYNFFFVVEMKRRDFLRPLSEIRFPVPNPARQKVYGISIKYAYIRVRSNTAPFKITLNWRESERNLRRGHTPWISLKLVFLEAILIAWAVFVKHATMCAHRLTSRLKRIFNFVFLHDWRHNCNENDDDPVMWTPLHRLYYGIFRWHWDAH